MKKRTAWLILWLLVLGLSGCGDAALGSSSEGTEYAENHGQTEKRDWSEQDIAALFSMVKKEGWEYIDSAVISDHAYGRVGAVLFRDKDSGTCQVAFLDADGYFQQCGIGAEIAEEPEFAYLGDGTVLFKAEAEDGGVYAYMLSFSVDGSKVSFRAEEKPWPVPLGEEGR